RGGADREVHVDIDRARLDALGLPLEAVAMALRGANLTVPAGHYDEGGREISVRAVGEFAAVDAVRDLVISTENDGSAVRFREVATVEDGFAEMRTRIRANGDEAVSFEVVKQSGKKTIEVADAVMARLTKLEKAFPPDIHDALIIDQSSFIR